jgi:predicted nucleic-acid-binding Zn-ribbon protein
MMWLKGCPKCRGDLYEEPAIGAHSVAVRYVSCLQCGYMLTDQEEMALRRIQPRRSPQSKFRVA